VPLAKSTPKRTWKNEIKQEIEIGEDVFLSELRGTAKILN
jgi:hypothetical protein